MAVISSCEKDFVGKNPTATAPSNQHTTTQVVSRDALVKDFPLPIGGGEGPGTQAAKPGRDYIISEYGLLFLRGNYRSFTFRVTNTPEGGYMENLVFSQHGEDTIRVFLVEYDLTEEEMEKISDWEAIDLTGKVAGITSWESATHQGYAYQSMGEEEPCQIGFVMDIESYCKKGNHPNGRKDDGSKCPLYAEITTYYFEDCGGAGNPGPLIDDNPFTDYPPGIEFPETGGGVDGPDDDNVFEDDEVETQPVVSFCYKAFLNSLSPEQRSWLMTHRDASEDIRAFIDSQSSMENGECTFPPGVEATIIEAINALINGDVATLEEFIDEKTCDNIAAQIADPAFKAKMDELEGKTDLDHEVGYSQNTDGSFTALAVGSTPGSSLSFPITPTTKGYMHVHNDDQQIPDQNGDGIADFVESIKIFSPKDIKRFLEIVLNADTNGIPISDIYGMVISSEGDYTLRFTGSVSDVDISFNPEALKDEYESYFEKYGKEKAFLYFLKDKIPNQSGIRLYKIKDNGTIKEKFLNENENLVSDKCD